MKYFFLFFSMSFLFSFSQKKIKGEFEVLNKSFKYTKLDYSNYGLVHTYVIVVDDNIEGNKIERRIIGRLRSTKHLYHTYYYILKFPPSFKNHIGRETVLYEFLKNLKPCENLFILMQNDISSLYVKRINYGEDVLIAKALVFDINLENIMSFLSSKNLM